MLRFECAACPDSLCDMFRIQCATCSGLCIDDIISLGNSSYIKVDYLTEDEVRVVTITSILQFPTPISFNGWEDANMVELETIYYYNWDAGYLIRAEEWITRDDGSRMQANLRTLKVSQVEEISQDVIQNINSLGK